MNDVDLAAVARLIGDPTRARILGALLAGRALTAGELARCGGVGAPSASRHLARLLDAGLLRMWAQGRHRYYALAAVEVAQALEALALVSPALPTTGLRQSRAAAALRPARLCYDHLAGELGVRIHDHLVEVEALRLDGDGIGLTVVGERWFAMLGVDTVPVRPPRRVELRACLDWTERRPHLAGRLGAAIATVLIDRHWLERRGPGERGLTVTPAGTRGIDALLGPVSTDGRPVEEHRS